MNTSKNIIIILFFLLIGGSNFAQDNPAVDSLVSLLETVEGEEHLQLLFSLASNGYISPDDRLEYSEDAIAYAADLPNRELLIEAQLQHGLFLYTIIDDNEGAIETFESAYNLSEEEGYAEGMANASMWMGRVYCYLGNAETGYNYYMQALEIAIDDKNSDIEARVLYYIGRQKRSEDAYDEALEYFRQAQSIAQENNDLELRADILGEEGLIYQMQGNHPEAARVYEEAATLYNQAGKKYDAATIYYRLSSSSLDRADYDVALEYLQQALVLFEELNSEEGILAINNSMGVIYFRWELLDKALEVGMEHLERSREAGNKSEIANALNNIGIVYNKIAEDSLKSLFGENFQDSVKIEPTNKYLDLFDEALSHYSESLAIREEMGDIDRIIATLMNMGIIYVYSGKPAMALEPLERAMEMNAEIGDRSNQATISLLLGQVYLAFDNYTTSLDYLNTALELALETDTKEITQASYQKLSELYQKQGNYTRALEYHKLFFATFEKLNTEEKKKAISDMQVRYETEAMEKENALLQAETELSDAKLKQTRVILIITIIAIGVFIVMMLQLIRQNNLKKKANRELAMKNELITEQKKEITDSIQYASRIQSAMLPPGDYVDSLLPERFILYMPRDIVSGDYYYITEKDGKVICVAADCTGHGVPGAFMSMLGIAFLNEIISKQDASHTDEMLEELRNHVITSLHQTGKEGESQDGMDLALYILDPETKQIEFSGANNSLLVYRNGDLIEAKADKMPIGIHTRHKEPFTRHTLELQKGDMVYTFSDGYPDQFGGPNQKKFMIKNFKKMLQEIHMKSMEEQQEIMKKTLADWMSETEQVDDILVIGVRIG